LQVCHALPPLEGDLLEGLVHPQLHPLLQHLQVEEHYDALVDSFEVSLVKGTIEPLPCLLDQLLSDPLQPLLDLLDLGTLPDFGVDLLEAG